MSYDPNQKKMGASLSQPQKIRQLFFSLRVLALLFIAIGIILLVSLPLFSFSERDQFIILVFYGLVSAGFLISRARSFIVLSKDKHQK